MKTELMYLVWVTTLTAVIWAPYIVDRILALGNLVVTGPTRTNVNDYRVILVR